MLYLIATLLFLAVLATDLGRRWWKLRNDRVALRLQVMELQDYIALHTVTVNRVERTAAERAQEIPQLDPQNDPPVVDAAMPLKNTPNSGVRWD